MTAFDTLLSTPCPDSPPLNDSPDGLFKLRKTAWFNLDEHSIFVRDRQHDLTLTFCASCLPLLQHFLTPQTLSSALLLPDVLDGPGLDEKLAFLRALIECSVLLPVTAPDNIEPSPALWAHWNIALEFYLGTRTLVSTPYTSVLDLEDELRHKTREQRQPSAFKDYPSQPFYPLDNPLTLTPPAREQPLFLDTLMNRHTSRDFGPQPLSRAQLSSLLFHTWGATVMEHNRLGDFFLKKTSPAGGSLHSAEVYPILMNVEGFEPGVYHYSVRRHGLELLSGEDPRTWIIEACGGQPWIEDAAVVFVSTARLERMVWKYAFSRALRVVLLDIGHLSQSLSLVATSLGLGCCTTAALRDEIFEQKLGLDYLEEPVFLVNGVGH